MKNIPHSMKQNQGNHTKKLYNLQKSSKILKMWNFVDFVEFVEYGRSVCEDSGLSGPTAPMPLSSMQRPLRMLALPPSFRWRSHGRQCSHWQIRKMVGVFSNLRNNMEYYIYIYNWIENLHTCVHYHYLSLVRVLWVQQRALLQWLSDLKQVFFAQKCHGWSTGIQGPWSLRSFYNGTQWNPKSAKDYRARDSRISRCMLSYAIICCCCAQCLNHHSICVECLSMSQHFSQVPLCLQLSSTKLITWRGTSEKLPLKIVGILPNRTTHNLSPQESSPEAKVLT